MSFMIVEYNTSIVRTVCKEEGEICGYIGTGDEGTCCANMECTYVEQFIGAAGTCTFQSQGNKLGTSKYR